MAMMTRWEPFRDLARLQDEVNRLFDDRGFRGGESVGWTPPCDIYEDEEAVTLRFELAGVDPKDVDVRFENGVLTVRGERKLERDDKRENYHRIERSYGTFTRSFSLPGTLDPERIKAEAKNGVLTVRGERKLERDDKRENYHRVERSYGTFTRSFSLPGTLDPERIKAEARNGVLQVTLPKKAEAKPRAIQVKVT